MSSIPAKVVAIEKRDDQFFQMVIQIGTKYRGSFNTLLFGEIKPYTGSLKNGRLDLVYYRNPGLSVGDRFPLWTLHQRRLPWGSLRPPHCTLREVEFVVLPIFLLPFAMHEPVEDPVQRIGRLDVMEIPWKHQDRGFFNAKSLTQILECLFCICFQTGQAVLHCVP
jgi:hypothetical protein